MIAFDCIISHLSLPRRLVNIADHTLEVRILQLLQKQHTYLNRPRVLRGTSHGRNSIALPKLSEQLQQAYYDFPKQRAGGSSLRSDFEAVSAFRPRIAPPGCLGMTLDYGRDGMHLQLRRLSCNHVTASACQQMWIETI